MKQHRLAGAAVALAMAIGSTAGAQAWATANGTFALKSCYSSSGGVRCDLGYAVTVADQVELFMDPALFNVIAGDGKTYQATQSAVGGSRLSPNRVTQKFYRGVSVPVSVLFPVPASTTVLQVVDIMGVTMRNIPVQRPSAVVTPAAAPVAAPPAALPGNGGIPAGYSVRLSNCKLAAGVYVCTATLTPPR